MAYFEDTVAVYNDFACANMNLIAEIQQQIKKKLNLH